MNVKAYALPFIGAFVVCAAAFLLLDMTVMNMQGLNLIFEP
jgi:hypothetical protein